MVKKGILTRIAEQIDIEWDRVNYPIPAKDMWAKWQTDYSIAVYKSNVTILLSEEDKHKVRKLTLNRYIQLNYEAAKEEVNNFKSKSLNSFAKAIKDSNTTAQALATIKKYLDQSFDEFKSRFDIYYPEDIDNEVKLKHLESDFQEKIFGVFIKKNKKLFRRVEKDLSDYLNITVDKRLEIDFETALFKQFQEQMDLYNETVAMEKNFLREFFESFGEYPQYLLDYQEGLLIKKIKDKWAHNSDRELTVMASEFTKVCNIMLDKLKTSEFTLFSPSEANLNSRKALSEIIVSTLPETYDENNEVLLQLLDALQITDRDALFSNFLKKKDNTLISAQNYLSNVQELSKRGEDLLSIVLILSETFAVIKDPTQEIKPYSATNREWIRQIVFYSYERNIPTDPNFNFDYKVSPWSLVSLAEAAIAENIENYCGLDNYDDSLHTTLKS